MNVPLFFTSKTEKETSCLPYFRLHDHPGKWGATSEFIVGLTKQIPALLVLNTLASEETLRP